MSSKGRGPSLGGEFEDYPTPMWAIRHLLQSIDIQDPATVLDPTAGKGNLLQAAHEQWPGAALFATEIQEKYLESLDTICNPTGGEASISNYSKVKWDGIFDLGLANPPFSRAEDVMQYLMTCCLEVYLLGRIQLLESKERSWWRTQINSNDFNFHALPNRPSFAGKGSDSTLYGWWEWPGDGRMTVLPFLTLPERKEMNQ